MYRTSGLILIAMAASCSTTGSSSVSFVRLDYPLATRGDVVDDYHGTKIADPYRWLEDPDAPQTRAWIDAENELTRRWINASPYRQSIEARLTALWNYERFGVPLRAGDRYFYTKNDGLQNQAVLYASETVDGAARVVLDPNTLAADGTIALTSYRPSSDGRYLAYALSEAGSDWQTIRVRDVATAKDLDDKVEFAKFSGLAWTHDGSGFFYSTYPDHDTSGKTALKNHRLQFHRLGTPASADGLVYADPEHPDWGFGGAVTHDGEMLVISIWQGTEPKNRVYVQDLRTSDAPVVKLLDDFDAEYDFIGKDRGRLFFKTDLAAARGRVIAIDLEHSARENWREIIPEAKDTLESVRFAGGHLIATYLTDAYNTLRVFHLDGRLAHSPKLPGLGSISPLEGEPDDDEAFFWFSGFFQPTSIWRYTISKQELALVRDPKVDFDRSEYETKQVFYASRDGTRVPMFLSHKKGLALTEKTPCLLYGYGGFNVPMKPAFSVANLVWMEMGGVFAVPCLRGGGEYGREWHEAGTKERKQNVFDDFIAAAEWLIAHGYTSPGSLAIRGGSNGGLLIGACMTQRPELFGAALPAVGVLDMLRYHRFTIGWGWASDYGTSDDPEELRYLLKYSPLHNLKPGVAYPPTLITTGDHDDRVVPAHSFKFAAALQQVQAGPNPVLIRIETRGGHGAGKPTSMQIEEIADQWAFLVRALDLHIDRASP